MVQEQGQPPPLLITISVDVGSTATKVSYFDHARGVVELVEINGAKSMPSAVFYSNDPAQRCRFGKHALSRPAKNCQCVLVEIKRMLACTSLGAVEGGTSTGNTSRWMPCHPPEEVAWQHHFRVAPTSEKDEEPRYLVAGSQESVAVHQVLGTLLAHVLSEAVEFIQQPSIVGGGAGASTPGARGESRKQHESQVVLQALVLAVPDCICASSRNLYIMGAQLALGQCGLAASGPDGRAPQVLLVPDTAGAAVQFALNQGTVQNVEPFLLVDWGGGALNAAVYEVLDRQLRCLAALSDLRLGGQDIESAFLVLLERKSGLDIRPSRVAKFKVRKAISAAIRDLTVADVSHIIKKSSKVAEVEADNLVDGDGISCSIGQAEFNELLQPLIARVLQHLHATLAAASLDAGRVRKVILLGGASRVPKFEAELEAVFSSEPVGSAAGPTGSRSRGRVERTLHRETAVVCGAALASLTALRGDWWSGFSGAGCSDGWGEAGATEARDIPVLPCQRTPPREGPSAGGSKEGGADRAHGERGGEAVLSLDLDAVKACMARKRESAFAPSATPKKGGAGAGDKEGNAVAGAGPAGRAGIGKTSGSSRPGDGGSGAEDGGRSPTQKRYARSKGKNGIVPKREARFREVDASVARAPPTQAAPSAGGDS